MGIPFTARHPADFRPPSVNSLRSIINGQRMRDGEDLLPEVVIKVRVPTPFERDKFNAECVRAGIIHYTQQQLRDLCLAGVSHLFPEESFDEMREQLMGLWAAQDAIRKCYEQREDKMIEIVEREQQLPASERLTPQQIEEEIAAIKPEREIPDAQRVRATAIQQDLAARYEPLQKAFADLSEQEMKRDWLCVQTYVSNWTGLEFTPDGNGNGGITRREAEWLNGKITSTGFGELAAFIFALHSIDGDEEKNLASLIESSSAPIGSHLPAESMSEQESQPGDGGSEPSTETPESASPPTTEKSSGSTTGSAKKTARSGRSRTVKA